MEKTLNRGKKRCLGIRDLLCGMGDLRPCHAQTPSYLRATEPRQEAAMRALVVYESMFGNTEAVAQAVAGGIQESMAVDVVEVGAAPDAMPEDVALLVVGGPTHAFGMSRPATRIDAARQVSAIISLERGIREWLKGLPIRTSATQATAFDTRVTSRVTGSAARGASRRLGRLDYPLVAVPEAFRVTGVRGPLIDGELDRARAWGMTLGAAVAARQASRS